MHSSVQTTNRDEDSETTAEYKHFLPKDTVVKNRLVPKAANSEKCAAVRTKLWVRNGGIPIDAKISLRNLSTLPLSSPETFPGSKDCEKIKATINTDIIIKTTDIVLCFFPVLILITPMFTILSNFKEYVNLML